MVGSEVLQRCLAHPRVDAVLTTGRTTTGVQHAKIREVAHADFHDFAGLEPEFSWANVCIYCVGVYQAQVSKDRFWEITVDYLQALIAALEQSNGDLRFCLFSAQGASTSERSPMRFAAAKGRAENILMASALAEKYAFRPGFILPAGERKNDSLTYRLFEWAYRLFPRVGVDATKLARVMVDVGLNGHDRIIFENGDLRAYRAASRS